MTEHRSIARRWMRLGAAAAMPLLALPVLAAAQSEVTLGDLRFAPDLNNDGRMRIHVEVEVQGFLAEADRQISALLTRSCSRRPFRVGGTRILGAGDVVRLSTPIRYEQWLCAGFETKLFRTTFDAEWSIRVNPPARLDNLRLTAGLENARGIPGEIEQWLDLQGRLRDNNIDIPIPTDCGVCPCADLADAIDLIAEEFTFGDPGGGNLLVSGVLSASTDMTRLTSCGRDRSAAGR